MKIMYFFLSVAIYPWLAGCAIILTEKADLNSTPEGVRIFPPKTYLFVNSEKKTTDIYILPDYANAYDLKPLTFISKQEFSVEVNDSGMLSKFVTNQDTTAFIDLFKAAAAVAKDAAAKGAGALTQNTISGTFGLQDGIYVLSANGVPVRLQP